MDQINLVDELGFALKKDSLGYWYKVDMHGKLLERATSWEIALWQQLCALAQRILELEKQCSHEQCHDFVCNGSRRHPRGTRGISCSCKGRDAAYFDIRLLAKALIETALEEIPEINIIRCRHCHAKWLLDERDKLVHNHDCVITIAQQVNSNGIHA